MDEGCVCVCVCVRLAVFAVCFSLECGYKGARGNSGGNFGSCLPHTHHASLHISVLSETVRVFQIVPSSTRLTDQLFTSDRARFVSKAQLALPRKPSPLGRRSPPSERLWFITWWNSCLSIGRLSHVLSRASGFPASFKGGNLVSLQRTLGCHYCDRFK